MVIRRATSRFALIASISLIGAAAHAQFGSILISELYTAGGSSAAGTTYQQDYIELFNTTSSPVSLLNWRVSYAAAGAAANTVSSSITFTAAHVIPANGFFLIKTGSPGTAGATNPTNGQLPDLTNTTISMSNTAGKLFLVNDTAAITFSLGANTSGSMSSNVVDFVGWGATANAWLGAAAAPPAGNNQNSIQRISNTSSNSVDFASLAPDTLQSTVPEPGTFALFSLAALPSAALLRRRK